MKCCNRNCMTRWWRHIVILTIPLLLSPLLFVVPEETLPAQASQCLYVMLLMAIFWCTEVISLALTGCIPMFVFPMLGILTPAKASSLYLTTVIMLFIGGLMVAFTVEKCSLHRRIALSVLHAVGTKPLWLMLGFMITTAFLSMWISNTAATAMMLPISEAVIENLTKFYKKKRNTRCTDKTHPIRGCTEIENESNYEESAFEPNNTTDECIMETVIDFPDGENNHLTTNHMCSDQQGEETQAEERLSTGNTQLDRFAIGVTLVIAYSANIGGVATLTGTPVNIVMKGYVDRMWEKHDLMEYETNINFTTWTVFGAPVALVCLVINWLWLTALHNGVRSLFPCCTKKSAKDDAIKSAIDTEYNALGKITFAEVTVSVMFTILVLLWFFRAPGFMTGWGDSPSMKPGYTHDAVSAIFIAFVLCMIPSKIPKCGSQEKGPVDTLLNWKTIQDKFPWSVLFLIGGGYCLAEACTVTGLSGWIADCLSLLSSGWPGWVIVFVLSLITTFVTDVMSNYATCNILMPIVGNLAESMGYSPLYLMIPVGVCASFAFMLPVATPPNAIIFTYGRIRIPDMIKGGLIMNVFCAAVVTISIETWVFPFFQLDVIPWFVNTTVTAAVTMASTP